MSTVLEQLDQLIAVTETEHDTLQTELDRTSRVLEHLHDARRHLTDAEFAPTVAPVTARLVLDQVTSTNPLRPPTPSTVTVTDVPAPAPTPAKARSTRTAGRKAVTIPPLAEIAAFARQARGEGKAVTNTLAAHYAVPVTTVKNWIYKATANGHDIGSPTARVAPKQPTTADELVRQPAAPAAAPDPAGPHLECDSCDFTCEVNVGRILTHTRSEHGRPARRTEKTPRTATGEAA